MGQSTVAHHPGQTPVHGVTRRTVRILGTHGVPANYGGFETAAQNVALHLVRRGWRVVMYCQVEGDGPIRTDVWRGMERVMIPISTPGWRGTSAFDLRSIRHACRSDDLCLTFGYNTGVFNVLQRLRGIPNVVNMDGIEWSRSRWGFSRQAILYINERFSALVGNHLIADHPEIENVPAHARARTQDLHDHLRRRSDPGPALHRCPATPRAGPRRLPHPDLPSHPGELDPRARPWLLRGPARRDPRGAR
jgi:hypothetical protein